MVRSRMRRWGILRPPGRRAPARLLHPVTHQVVPLTVEAVAVGAAGDEGSVGPGAQRLLQPVRAHEARARDAHDVHAGMRQQAPLRVEQRLRGHRPVADKTDNLHPSSTYAVAGWAWIASAMRRVR